MYLNLSSEGCEGSIYAVLTTVSNLSGTIAFDISTAIANIWDTSNETLRAGNFYGVTLLTLICVVVSPLPLILINLIPKNRVDQNILINEGKKNRTAGIIFVLIIFFTLMITAVETIYTIYFEQ